MNLKSLEFSIASRFGVVLVDCDCCVGKNKFDQNDLIKNLDWISCVASRIRNLGGDKDQEGFRFWTIDEICSIRDCDIKRSSKEGVAKRSFIFCDYFDFSWAYALDTKTGEIIMVGHPSDPLTVKFLSMEDFFRAYVNNSLELYPGFDSGV